MQITLNLISQSHSNSQNIICNENYGIKHDNASLTDIIVSVHPIILVCVMQICVFILLTLIRFCVASLL